MRFNLIYVLCLAIAPVPAFAQAFEIGPGGVRIEGGRRDYDRGGYERPRYEDYGRYRGGGTCAREGGFCQFRGEANVRYGARGLYTVLRARDGIPCNNQVFGDPAPGLVKRCVID